MSRAMVFMQKASSAFEKIVDGEVVAVEDDQRYAAATDGCIGKVEDSTEKDVAAYEWHPVGPGEEGEVEHIDHPTGEKTAIAFAESREVGHLVQTPAAFAEDEAIEEIVYDVAGCPCHHSSPTHQQTPRCPFLDDVEKSVGKKSHGHDAEE